MKKKNTSWQWQLAVAVTHRISFYCYCLLLLLTVSLLSSCKLINPDSPIPAYIRLEKIILTTDPQTQGSANNAITDAWVYVDGQIIGVFQMPVNVPVLYSGTHTVVIKPGVIVNGIAASRIDYPFYAAYIQTVNLEPGKVDTLRPTVTYGNCTFSQLEDFDQAGTTVTSDPHYQDTLHIINDPAIELEGEGKCGAALLNANRVSFRFISIDSFPMPAGSLQYMELNYKSDYEFSIGLQCYMPGIAVPTDIVVLNPSSTWQKIYVNLNLASDQNPGSTYFKVYMWSDLDQTVQPEAHIYFDNIKVIHNG